MRGKNLPGKNLCLITFPILSTNRHGEKGAISPNWPLWPRLTVTQTREQLRGAPWDQTDFTMQIQNFPVSKRTYTKWLNINVPYQPVCLLDNDTGSPSHIFFQIKCNAYQKDIWHSALHIYWQGTVSVPSNCFIALEHILFFFLSYFLPLIKLTLKGTIFQYYNTDFLKGVLKKFTAWIIILHFNLTYV